MLAYFPKIYPDELLASAIARYHVHTAGVSHRATHMELYGVPHSRTSVNFPRNLLNLHFYTSSFTNMTLRELVMQTTLYPYYFAYANNDSANKVYKKMVSKGGQSHSIVLGWSPTFERLKVCPDCITDDLKTYGEAYWHRRHQLDSAHLCSVHVVPLLVAKTRYFYDFSTPLEALTERMETVSYLPPLNEKTRQRLLETTAYAEDCLAGRTMVEGIQPFSESGRRIFRTVYPAGKLGLDMTQIERDLISHFGDQFLELLGLPITPGILTGWVRAMFRRNPSPMPSKHIVFKLFLDNYVLQKLENAQPDPYDRLQNRLWICQNPAAEHRGEKVIREVYKVPAFKRTGVLGFICTCGYTFLAKTDGWDFIREPKKIKVQEFGSVFIARARHLRACGLTITAIAQQLEVRRNVVYAVLNENYGTTVRPFPQKAWVARRKQRADKTAAALPRPALEDGDQVKTGSRVDYAARDREYVKLISLAAMQIRLTAPPVRASVNYILKVAGIGYSQLVRRHFFPLSLSKLKELGETTDSIRARKKAWKT